MQQAKKWKKMAQNFKYWAPTWLKSRWDLHLRELTHVVPAWVNSCSTCFPNWRTKLKNKQIQMSLDGTLVDILCLMRLETFFLTILNDLKGRFCSKNLHFLGFRRWRGKENGCWSVGLMSFIPKQFNLPTWVNSHWNYRRWLKSHRGILVNSCGSEQY